MTDEAARAQRRYERERTARLEAESIAEQGLRDLYEVNQSLDARIKERTAELEAANAAKNTLLAHVGHELRTPLNGIAGMLELLDGAINEPLHRRWLDSARASSDRLEKLVDRILRFIALEGVDLRTAERVETVGAVMARAETRWTNDCARAGMLLITENHVDDTIHVTQTDDLDAAIDEFMSNAIVHAEPGALRFSVRSDADTVTFELVDTGPGVTEANLIASGEPLGGGHDVSTAPDSRAGLGLAFVDRVARSLGGASGIEAIDGGTRAWIRLPEREVGASPNRP